MSTSSILSLLKTSGLVDLTRQQLAFLESHQAELKRDDKETLKRVWEWDLKRVEVYERLLPDVQEDALEFCRIEVESILFGGARTLAQSGAKADDLKDIFGDLKKRFPFINVKEMVEHAQKSFKK